jgi:hypothetical protein
MALKTRRLDGDKKDICELRGMTPRRGWAGQTCTLYFAEGTDIEVAVAGFNKAMADNAAVEVAGSEGARSIVAQIRIAGVDPGGLFVSGVFVTDTVFSGE